MFWHLAQGSEKKGEYLVTGDVKEGWKVFAKKKCNACHSIWGEGGKGGPDLGNLPESYKTPSQLSALIWNHGPQMWAKMPVQKIPYQKIDKKEMADLFTFLYFIRYMDEPGSPSRGEKLIQTKGCIKCHSLKE
ncbi:MAG: c-type cytochrome, partial [Thermodesulfobacteriota bacterium]